jgi:large subunit ribosomal protein L9
MKIILLQDVNKIGNQGDVCNVADGYARNYLIPKGFAVVADNKNLKTLGVQKEKQAKREKIQKNNAQKLAERLSGQPIVIKTKAGESGRLFGSVTSMELAAAVKAQLGLEIDKRKIELPEPIKALGNHEVKVKLHPEVHSEFTVTVEAD